MASGNRDSARLDDMTPEGPVIYDDDNDVLYVMLSESEVAKTESLDDLRLVDYDAKGMPVGVEFISASGKRWP